MPTRRAQSPDAPVSRRRLLAGAAAASSAALLAACGGEDKDDREQERDAADLEIVTFLLGVEAVEAAFWRELESRPGLAPERARDLVATVARNEREHVTVMERWARKLGRARPKAPATAFDAIFAAGPQEAFGAAASLENLSAAAYLGQINRVQDRNLLASLLAIHTVEGRQAAAVNRLAGRGFSVGTSQLEGATPDGSFAEPMVMREVRIALRRYTGEATG